MGDFGFGVHQSARGRAGRIAARRGLGTGTGDLSRIGYALGGTRARLGVLFVLPSVSLALGHYSSDHSSEGLLGDRPRSGAGLGRMGSGHSPVRVYPRMSRMEASTVPRGRLSSSSSSSPAFESCRATATL